MEYSIDDLMKRYPILKDNKEEILRACDILVSCFKNNGKLLICGNGGSSSDSNHITGELMKSFCKKRPINDELKREILKIENNEGLIESLQKGLPCIALDNHQSLNTAFINDVKDGGLYMYAQQVNVYGNKGDVLLAISTSGNSINVYNACLVAKAKGMKIISLTGNTGGKLKSISDININVNEKETFKIQELHLPIYHFICLEIEDRLF